MSRRIVLLILLIGVVGCGGKQMSSEPIRDYATMTTYFATDRSYAGGADPGGMFTGGRDTLHYGVCNVSIPRDHRMGELESPSIWKLEFREDPEKHVVLLDATLEGRDAFFERLRGAVLGSIGKNAFVFVHGYNVSFENAARRTAQMAYDLSFDGAPVFYSWPSQNDLKSYTIDEQNIEWTQPHLQAFLGDFFARSDAQNVYLIAHSMGNRGLTRAVADLLSEHPEYAERLTEIILAAPDIDKDVFVETIAPAMIQAGRPITLYVSSEDVALAASRKVHGEPRAGDSGDGMVVLAGIETIDATKVDTSFLGHTYFAENRSALADMFHLIRDRQRADERFGLQAVDTAAGRYWVFKE